MKKALIIVAITLVVIVGGCATVGFYAYRSFTQTMAEMTPLADDFIARWNARDVDGLYALAGGAGDREAFVARTTTLLDAIGRMSSHSMQNVNVNAVNGETTAHVAWRFVGEKLGGVLRLTLDHGDRWTIKSYTIELDGGPAAATPVAEKTTI